MRNFKDRISTIADRKKITFEDNQEERFAIVEFADEATELGTDINRTNMMGMQGYINSDITFNTDGSITTVYPNNVIETTIFNEDGSIKQEYNLDGEIKNKFTYFDEDGSIVETFTERPYIDKNTLFLLHGDMLTDSSFYQVPMINNGVVISTTQSKFGGSSLYFDGNSWLKMSMSELGLNFLRDWTLEWWDYPTQNNGGASAVYCMPNDTYFGFIVYAPDGNNIRIFAGNDANYSFAPESRIGQYYTNTWTHRAVCKKNNKIYCFENGIKTIELNSSNVLTITEEMYLGYRATTQNRGGFKGYLSELRISNIARWTENFTPPTEPYDITKRP